MTKQINTSITIAARKETIWEILMDVDSYPEWNPFISSITGGLKEGNKIQVKLQGMTFQPKILTLKENLEFKWLGHFWFKGLFDGMHQFKLIDNGDGTTRFEQNEHFSGILVRLFAKTLEKNTKLGFEEMNTALKLRAEKDEGNTLL